MATQRIYSITEVEAGEVLALVTAAPSLHQDGVRHHLRRQVVHLAERVGVGVRRVDLEHQRLGDVGADGVQDGRRQQVGALQRGDGIQLLEHPGESIRARGWTQTPSPTPVARRSPDRRLAVLVP